MFRRNMQELLSARTWRHRETSHALRQGLLEHRKGPAPLGDHLNAERLGGSREPCNTWADGGLAAICSKSALKNRLERMTGNTSTRAYPDGIPLIEKMSTKKPLAFPESGRSRDRGVQFFIEWALRGMEVFIFPTDGPLMDRGSPIVP